MDEDVSDDFEELPDTSLEDAVAGIAALMGGEAPAAPAPAPATPETSVAPALVVAAPEAPKAPETAPVATPAPAAPAPAQAGSPAPAAPANPDAPDPILQIAQIAVNQAAQQYLGAFADIKTPADLMNLMRTDTQRYNDYVVARAGFDMAYQQIAGTVQQQRQATQTAATTKTQAWHTEQSAKLKELLPELFNPETGPAIEREMRDYAKSRGIETAGRSAADIRILYEAMQAGKTKAAEAAQLEAANKKAAGAPPVQTPGARTAPDAKHEKAQANETRFMKTGRLDDAAAVLADILSR